MPTLRYLIYAASLASLIFMSGCDSATRDIESEISKSNPSDHNPVITDPGQSDDNSTNSDNNNSLVPISPTPATDNNETNSTVKVDAKNAYKLAMTLSKSKYQQYEIGILHYSLKELYTDEPLDDNIIQKIVFHVKDNRYCKFVDYTGKETTTLTLDKEKNQISAQNDIRIKMSDHSGTTEISVTATVILPDNSTRELYNTIPVVVMKNKTASITVNPYGTKWVSSGENAGLFVEKYVFHVVDKYGNKAKDGTYLQIGAVNDPKLYTLGYDAHDTPNNITATLKEDRTFSIDTTRTDISLLTNTSVDNEDSIVILPNASKNDPTYLGGWDVQNITGDHTATLVDDYTGNPTGTDAYGVDDNITIGDISGLTFAIGDEDRYNPCSKTLANAAFYFPDGAQVKDGLVYAELRYQPYMVGKTIFIYANAVVDGERIGIAREIHLKGEGLAPATASCKNDSNTTMAQCSVWVPMELNGYGNLARWVQPSVRVTDHSTFSNVTVSNTQCEGHALVTFYGIRAGKTATASIGDAIVWERLHNH